MSTNEKDTGGPVEKKEWDKSMLECRMYEKEFPEVEELVMVLVKKVAEMGVYVVLEEYNNLEGMILMSELSRRRIRSINKLIREGRREVVMVLRTDDEQNYIDLSKKRASDEDAVKHEKKFQKSKQVHSILRRVASQCKVPLIHLYEQFGWDLYKRYGHAYEGLRQAHKKPEEVLGRYAIDEKVMTELLRNIKMRLAPQPVKIRADLEVMCWSEHGIEAIKAALLAGRAMGSQEEPIQISLVASPLYVMTTTTINKQEGIDLLQKAISEIRRVLESKQGQLQVKAEPRVVGEREDRLLQVVMETAARQTREVPGDDDSGELAVSG